MFLSLVTLGNIQQVTAHFAKVLSDMYFWIKTENSTNCSTALIKKRTIVGAFWLPWNFLPSRVSEGKLDFTVKSFPEK